MKQTVNLVLKKLLILSSYIVVKHLIYRRINFEVLLTHKQSQFVRER